MRAKNNRIWLLGGLLGALALATIAWGFSFIINDSTDLPIKWRPGSIVIHIMANNSTTLSDGLTRAGSIQAAMTDAQRGWNRYLGDAQFAPQIDAEGSGGNSNGRNEVFFANKAYNRDFDSSTLAITTVLSRGNERAEGDTIFNTAYTWDSYRGSRTSAMDIQRVALHELGHTLGLDHPDEDGQSVTAIMNSHISNLDSLVADDINGAQSIYGPPGVPANDNFANAIPVTLTGNMTTVTGFNTNATKESGEPNHAGNKGGRSIWWKWTASVSGNVSIDTRGSYSDTTLGIYTGSSLSSLTAVASDDDIEDGVVQASFVTFNATAGTTYVIAVDGFNGDDGAGADCAAIILNLTVGSTGTAAPAITTQPSSVTVTAGSSASFAVFATGSAPLSYQWFFGTTAIAGATSASYGITNAQASNAGNYYVTVTNSAGSATSNVVTLTVNGASTPPPTTPSGSGGGGGGGAPSVWFCVALSVVGICRRFFRRQQ